MERSGAMLRQLAVQDSGRRLAVADEIVNMPVCEMTGSSLHMERTFLMLLLPVPRDAEPWNCDCFSANILKMSRP